MRLIATFRWVGMCIAELQIEESENKTVDCRGALPDYTIRTLAYDIYWLVVCSSDKIFQGLGHD